MGKIIWIICVRHTIEVSMPFLCLQYETSYTRSAYSEFCQNSLFCFFWLNLVYSVSEQQPFMGSFQNPAGQPYLLSQGPETLIWDFTTRMCIVTLYTHQILHNLKISARLLHLFIFNLGRQLMVGLLETTAVVPAISSGYRERERVT